MAVQNKNVNFKLSIASTQFFFLSVAIISFLVSYKTNFHALLFLGVNNCLQVNENRERKSGDKFTGFN